jgi:hypothetical protein
MWFGFDQLSKSPNSEKSYFYILLSALNPPVFGKILHHHSSHRKRSLYGAKKN